MATSSSTTTSARTRVWATGRRQRCTMPEQHMADLPIFDSRRNLSYSIFGRTADKQRLPKLVGVHLVFAHSWSKGWGQPQLWS